MRLAPRAWESLFLCPDRAGVIQDSAYKLLRISLLETVWKIRMGSALRSQESEKPGERHPYRRLVLPKARDPSPSSYFPNSFSTKFVNKGKRKPGPCLRAPAPYYRTPDPANDVISNEDRSPVY
jgi:hypothetical protein